MDKTEGTHWHTYDIPTILEHTNTRLAGLSVNEVNERLRNFGYNEFNQEEDEPIYKKIFESLKDNHLILLLLGSALISAVMGHYEDAISITLVCYSHVIYIFF